MYPLPTGPGVSTANFASSHNRSQNGTTFDARIDHTFSQNTKFFARYSFNDVTTITPTGFPDVNGINPGGVFNFAGTNATRAQNLHLNLVRILGPRLLLELKAGYLRAAIQSLPVNAGKDAATQIGFPCNGISCISAFPSRVATLDGNATLFLSEAVTGQRKRVSALQFRSASEGPRAK